MKRLSLYAFLILLPLVISCAEELTESIKFLDSYKETRFLEEANNQNIKTKIDDRMFIQYSTADKDKSMGNYAGHR